MTRPASTESDPCLDTNIYATARAVTGASQSQRLPGAGSTASSAGVDSVRPNTRARGADNCVRIPLTSQPYFALPSSSNAACA